MLAAFVDTHVFQVSVAIHLDHPLAHTVNIEPLTPADWEIIELHASFLETHLLFQVRALPNPSYNAPPSIQVQHAHPLTIHLSHTSTVNVIITSLDPPQPSSVPYAKLAPDSEVHVAPKLRPKMGHGGQSTIRSIASKKSTGPRSTMGKRQHNHKAAEVSNSVFLRPIDRSVCVDLLAKIDDDSNDYDQSGLAVWVDPDIMRTKTLRGSAWATVSVIKPSNIGPPLDPHAQQRLREAQESEAGMHTSTVVAKLCKWDDAPNTQHAVLSSKLCSTLNIVGTCGGVIGLARAPKPCHKNNVAAAKLYPFASEGDGAGGLKFKVTEADHRFNTDHIKALYNHITGDEKGLLDGPVSNGQLLPPLPEAQWSGGIMKLVRSSEGSDTSVNELLWCMASDLKPTLTIQSSIPSTLDLQSESFSDQQAPTNAPHTLVSVDSLIEQVKSQILHSSSVLLTGSVGAGKTAFARHIAHSLRSEHLFHTAYFSCTSLTKEDTRISTVKETISRIILTGSWSTRLGGHSLLILDDLDRLCPVETELQTVDNGRSRQISEIFCSLVREACGPKSKIVILATAQSKESLQELIIGANVIKDIVALKAPDKDARKQILEALTGYKSALSSAVNGYQGCSSEESDGESGDDAAWMGTSSVFQRPEKQSHLTIDLQLDLLDLAGQIDGYMPGDLSLLVARAKNETLIRTVEGCVDIEGPLRLTAEDFQRALKGFTPASLRNVTLHSSRTTFASIGGLHETRKILLETLQYPTTYAPIFAQCPLRLRSGLLLYGYPGCGKTLLASAVAGECGLNFISVKGPEILNKYIGASEKSVRDLFERAESARPCVLFFDEFDSIAPKRGHDSTGVTDRVVNQLLTQMDGAEGLSGVYVLAATSRPDLIDPALLRPGRLDKSLLCDMPNSDDRLDILQALAKKLTISPSVLGGKSSLRNLGEVARRTAGYSGADLQAVIYNAHLEAIHDFLGDHDLSTDIKAKKGKDSQRYPNPAKPDILQFRFGEADTTGDLPNSSSRAKQAADYAAIIAKLDGLKLAKKREKLARRGMVNGSIKQTADAGDNSAATQEVVIEWRHIEASLASTRSSISLDERRRLERIYREFLGGRSGEFSDGQGSTEVGGRSSLM